MYAPSLPLVFQVGRVRVAVHKAVIMARASLLREMMRQQPDDVIFRSHHTQACFTCKLLIVCSFASRPPYIPEQAPHISSTSLSRVPETDSCVDICLCLYVVVVAVWMGWCLRVCCPRCSPTSTPASPSSQVHSKTMDTYRISLY